MVMRDWLRSGQGEKFYVSVQISHDRDRHLGPRLHKLTAELSVPNAVARPFAPT